MRLTPRARLRRRTRPRRDAILHQLTFAKLSALAAIVALSAMPGAAQAQNPPTVVSVLYAGSLVTPMEGPIKAALRAQNVDFQGEGGGSKALANLIVSGVRTPDVFISVDPKLVAKLGDRVASSVTFAGASLGIAWAPQSRYVSLFQSVVAGKTSLQSALQTQGLRIGRTDPIARPQRPVHDRRHDDVARARRRPAHFRRR